MSIQTSTEKLSHTARNLADDVLQSAEEAVKATRTKADASLGVAESRVRQLRQDTSPAIQDLASRAQDIAARSIEYCAETSDRARRQLRHASEATSRYVSQQPGKSVAIAVASGAALGALALWLSRRNSTH